ncbi:S8 family peptidase [Edaphobacter sp. HDX4]|uniref:S8 family peptidase n=1 Tax=Edaphobacter sp. HDX4 TaxID=2794064 RepID=UPI002FE60DC5
MSTSTLLCSLLCSVIWSASGLYAQVVTKGSGEHIVANRYLVVYRDGVVPADAATRVRAMGARLVGQHSRFGIVAVQGSAPAPEVRLHGATSTAAAPDDQVLARSLAAQPDVAFVLHDRLVTAHRLKIRMIPDPVFSVAIGRAAFDTYYNSPQGWAVRQVGGYGANIPGGPVHGPWDLTRGQGVRIAILDSGVDATHPDIAPNLELNISEVNPTALPSVCDDGTPQDQDGHGTWTASLAAGALGPGTGKTVGVAPAASLLNIKVLERLPATIGADDAARCNAGSASGLLSWVIQGIDDAIANHADVISMSLGTILDLSTGDGAGTKALFDRITYAAAQAGAVLVAAAGNDASNLSDPRYIEIPAQSRGVLAVVASTNPDCSENTNPGSTCAPGPSSLAYYSNYGAPLDAVAAPGGSYPSGGDMDVSGWVRGACSSGLPGTDPGLPSEPGHSFGCFNLGHAAYVQAIGTSASAPLVAGAAALLRAIHPEWDAATTIDAIRSMATPANASLAYPEVTVGLVAP